MLFEVALTQGTPPSPFKMNLAWLKEEDFVNKVKEAWNPFDDSNESAPLRFHQNLKREK